MKSPITTHILDTAKGRPAAGVAAKLLRREEDNWLSIASDKTNEDGRIMEWFDRSAFKPGHYRIIFDTETYLGVDSFFPEVSIDFQVKELNEHYHVPLLLSPFGYSTYRGS